MRKIPGLVWLLTGLSFLMSISSGLIIPTYFGFDEPQHVDMVVAIVHGDGWDDPGQRRLAQGVRSTSDLYYNPGSDTRPLDVGLKTIPPRGERPALAEAGGFGESTTGLPNQMVQHPPLYYALVAAGVSIVGADDWSYDRLVAWMRVLTALLAAGIPLLTWLICRRLGTSESVGVAAAALTLAVPGLTRITGTVSNDSFMVLTAAGLSLALVHVATGDLSKQTAVLAGGVTAAALLTKGFGLPLPLLVVLAYLIGARGVAGLLRRAAVPGGIALAVAFVFGGLWWVRNLIAFGAIQPNGLGGDAQKVLIRPNVQGGEPLWPFVTGVFDRLTRSFWGGVGITSSPTLSEGLAVGVSLVALVLVMAGIALGVRRGRHRLVLLMLAVPVLLAMVIVVQGALPIYIERGQIRGVHGRYLYLAIPGLAVCAAIAADRLLWRARGLLPALAVIGVIGMQVLGGFRVLKRLWYTPHSSDNSPGIAFDHLQVLSPWSGWVTDATFALTALAALAALALAGYQAVTRSGPEPVSQPA